MTRGNDRAYRSAIQKRTIYTATCQHCGYSWTVEADRRDGAEVYFRQAGWILGSQCTCPTCATCGTIPRRWAP